MPKFYYKREGRPSFCYTAMCLALFHRKMDLPAARVRQIEDNGRHIYHGWLLDLKKMDILECIEHAPQQYMWLVDEDAAAAYIGCKPASVLKYMEVLYRLSFIPISLKDVPLNYGFYAVTMRISHHEPEPLPSVQEEEEEVEDPYELPPPDETSHCIFNSIVYNQ